MHANELCRTEPRHSACPEWLDLPRHFVLVLPMSIDVVDLRNFYGQRLGVVARRFVARGIRALWREAAGQRVLGIGYGTPYLGLFREDAERCLAFMPASQGVMKWPTARPALSALVDENELPLTDSAVDRVLLVHGLEMTNDPAALLREVWRVLAGGGRLLAVVPNRRGFGRAWTRRRSGMAGLIRAPRSISFCARPGSRRPDGARRCTCRRSSAAGFCVRPWPGSAPARHAVGALCRRASGGSDQAGLSRGSGAGAKSAVWCRHSSRCWRRRRADNRICIRSSPRKRGPSRQN